MTFKMTGSFNQNRWLLFLPVFTLLACDPAQTIRIENHSAGDAEITFSFNPDNRYAGFGNSDPNEALKVVLDSTAENSVREYYFGMGTWKIQSSLDSLIAAVNSIEISTPGSTQTFTGEQQIRRFFESRISDKHKEVIEIRLE